MTTKTKTAAVRGSKSYLDLVAAFPLHVIQTDEELNKAIALAESLDIGDLPDDVEEYLGTLTLLIHHYEAKRHRVPELTGAGLVRFLIEDRGVSQSDVAKATGLAGSTISEILNGKRGLGVNHIRVLSDYFKIDPGRFIVAEGEPAPNHAQPQASSPPRKPHRAPLGRERLEAIRAGRSFIAEIVTKESERVGEGDRVVFFEASEKGDGLAAVKGGIEIGVRVVESLDGIAYGHGNLRRVLRAIRWEVAEVLNDGE